MNKFGWFLTGMFIFGMVIDMMLAYHNLGSVDLRIWLFVLCILGIGSCVTFFKDAQSGGSE